MSINIFEQKHPVIFYDGYCYLCSNTVRLILRLDRKKKLRFMNIQKAISDPNFKKINAIYKDDESIIFLNNKNIYTKSNAIISIFKALGGGFKLMGILYIFPLLFRDYIYDLIARNRYKLFGKSVNCHLPGSEFTDRFL